MFFRRSFSVLLGKHFTVFFSADCEAPFCIPQLSAYRTRAIYGRCSMLPGRFVELRNFKINTVMCVFGANKLTAGTHCPGTNPMLCCPMCSADCTFFVEIAMLQSLLRHYGDLSQIWKLALALLHCEIATALW